MSTFLRSLTLSTAFMGMASLGAPLATAAPIASRAKDLGAIPASQLISASLVLKVRSIDALESLVEQTQEPGSPSYHKFLSTNQFTDQFAPSQRDIATITGYLKAFGITVTDVYADRLLIKASGTADAFTRAFEVDVHEFSDGGKRFHRSRHAPKIPLLLRDLLVSVQGFSSEALFRPKHKSLAGLSPRLAKPVVLPAEGATATGEPGNFTVGDVANLYNINPLYDAAIDGHGRTVGIATLANFDPADAYAYWSMVGLDVDQHRITQVHVDGGGPLGADEGSGETCLDVEQSGGLAPGAKVIVYDAPNTDVGFIDVFYKAVSDNKVDSLSVSWGSSEVFYFAAIAGDDLTNQMRALHQVFLEAAAKGISMFAASGDSGAFDINDKFNDPVNNVLTVDYPAADPAITAAGGTTTPVVFNLGEGTPDLVLPTERVWGWDYVEDYFIKNRGPSNLHRFFPVGAGGGVSTFWGVPSYQANTRGIRRTEPGQSIILDDGSGAGPVDLLDLPARFAGRNVPDVSLDGDPVTGFSIVSTEDGGLINQFGGTSFVAPQLNGITALLSQAAGTRLGLLNPMLYRFKNSFGGGTSSPIVDITAGSNWFYNGIRGYEPGAGLGVLNVASLAAAIRNEAHGRH